MPKQLVTLMACSDKSIGVACQWIRRGLYYVMRCAIWYHLHNLKNMKNTQGGVLLLVKLQVAFLHECRSRF